MNAENEMDVKDIYPFSTCNYEIEEEESSSDDEHGVKTISNPATPCTPMTPQTPGTPASHTVSDDPDRSTYSISMDSGIGSPPAFNLPGNQHHNIIDVRSLTRSVVSHNAMSHNTSHTTPHKSVKASKFISSQALKSDHTNKEKHRRERIKDSCDQLRVLLPYIRGRKTDMASILEMCVDYLQVVNAFMPQVLQDQIVEILSKEPGLVPNRDSILIGKNKKPGTIQESKTTLTGLTSQTEHMAGVTQKKPSLLPSDILSAHTVSDMRDLLDSQVSKRARLQDITNAANDAPHLDARLDPIVAGHSDVTYTIQNSQNSGLNIHTKPYSPDIDDQAYPHMYPTPSDSYNSAQQIYSAFTTTGHKTPTVDQDTYRPMYVDSNLYHYYPSVVPSTLGALSSISPTHHYQSSSTISPTRLYQPSPEYVNPNNILASSSYGSFKLKPAPSPISSRGKEDLVDADNN